MAINRYLCQPSKNWLFLTTKEIKSRSAYPDYFIEDKFKLRAWYWPAPKSNPSGMGKVNFVDRFCVFFKGELWVKNMHIAEYRFGTTNNHIAVHDRKLLLTKRELRKLENKLKDKGYTIVPLRIFFNGETAMPNWRSAWVKGKELRQTRIHQRARYPKGDETLPEPPLTEPGLLAEGQTLAESFAKDLNSQTSLWRTFAARSFLHHRQKRGPF